MITTNENNGQTFISFLPTEFNNQKGKGYKPHEIIGDHDGALLASGGLNFAFLSFKSQAEFIGAAGSVAFQPLVQVGAQ